jgi:hydrogenase maturation protease
MVDILTLVDKMPEIHLFTIAISKMNPMNLDLSPKVSDAIPKVTKMILELIEKIKE